MLKRIRNGLARRISVKDAPGLQIEAEAQSQRSLLDRLAQIPYWEDKINLYKQYAYHPHFAAWVKNGTPLLNTASNPKSPQPLLINYGCGNTLLDGWLNVDLHASDARNYRTVNLLNRHPFDDNTVSFGFSEDMMEHLTQGQSIFLLAEIYRTLKPGGVMRFSFPGLEGVLSRHYTPATETRVAQGEFEAYAFWDHIHFYSKEELRLVAEHVGFSVEFVSYGVSRYPELSGRDTRDHQMDLNTYVELTKPSVVSDDTPV